MKRLFLAAAAAALSLAAMADTADELRVYVNPGHGSYTANDRPMAIRGHGPYSRYNTDTLSFFESNTNLRKGFGVVEALRNMGLKFDPNLNQTGERWQIGAARDMSNNIVMSHVKCGPYHEDNGTANQLQGEGKPVPEDLEYYNRSLSEIDMEVDANNFDMFISIHSNALSSDGKWYTTNFPIILYRGYDDCRTEEGLAEGFSSACRAIAEKVWPYHMANTHEGWSAYSTTNMNIRGDLNFYAGGSTSRGYKGYLGVLKHSVPGFLIEGYFHQYAPAALRHMNWDVDYVEGINYAHGIADYFGLQKESTGIIYGIVRDMHERFRDDTYVPIPTHEDAYKPLDNVTVTLKKAGQTVATYTTDNQFNGAFVFRNLEPGTYTVELACEGYKTPEPAEVEVIAATVSYPSLSMESESYIPPVVNYVDYPDPFEGTAFGARDEYSFDQSVLDREIPELAETTVARLIHHDGKLYILAHNADGEAKILVLNAATLEVISTPGTEGTEGTDKNVADITVSADGILIASAKELCHYNDDQVEAGETRGECNFYRWTNNSEGVPEGNPELWMTTKLSANMYRAKTGESLTYQGTMTEGRLVVSSENAYPGGTPRVWFNVIEVADGEKLAESHRNSVFSDYFDYNTMGHYRISVSPLDSEKFVVDGSGVEFAEAAIDDIANDYTIMGAGVIPTLSENEGCFRYAGHSYMVAPDQSAEGNGGVILVDITEGLDKASVVPTVNTSVEVADLGLAHATGAALAGYDDYGDVSSANMVLFLLRGNKITRFTTEGVKQPQPDREYAYGITVSNEGTQYTVNFNSTGDAPASAVVLTETETGRVETIEGPAVVKGENTISFDATNIPENEYSVAVKIVSKSIPEAGCYYSDSNGVTKRGGVVTITDPESDNLGYTIVTTGGAGGVKIYAPDGTVTGPFFVGDSRLQASNQSSMFRGAERNGKAVFSDWSDGGAGYWVIDPSNPVDMTQLLAGEKGGQGSYTYNGQIIGGGSSCVAFQGKGENMRMLSFLEDYPQPNTAGAENRVYAYNIGNDEQITRVPDQAYDNLTGGAFLANQNVEIIPINDDVFAVGQCRGEGNNVSGCPGFAFITNEGEILFQSPDLEELTSVNSGIACSVDGKLFAVGQYGGKINVYNLSWDEDGFPVFAPKCVINTNKVSWSTMRFDAGGNLHVYEREDGGYHAYSLPDVAPESIVPAKAQYTVRGNGESGVDDIVVDEVAEGQPVYYNLSGVRVDAENLSAGVYIKVVGSKATKVVIR